MIMLTRKKCLAAIGAGVLTLALHAGARPDYYTHGFYTRTSEEAFYLDQGGIIDPFYVPAQDWSLVPRVTLEGTRSDNYFQADRTDQQSVSALNLIPGALLIYGRPEHNHLYSDVSVSIPLQQSSGAVEDDPSYVIVLGGALKTSKSQVYGRLGHRRFDSEDAVLGARVIKKDVVVDVGAEYRMSAKTSLGLAGQIEDHDFGNDAYLNYRRYYGAGRLFYRLTKKCEAFLQAGVGRDDVDEDSESEHGDADYYDLSVGLRGKPSPKTGISGRVGYNWRDQQSGSNSGHWIANIGANVTPFGQSRFSAELLADVRPDVDSGGENEVDQRFSLGVNRRIFSERLRGSAQLLLGTLETQYADGTTKDDYWGYTLGLDWWTRWKMSVGVGYSYRDYRRERSSSYETGLWNFRMSWNY